MSALPAPTALPSPAPPRPFVVGARAVRAVPPRSCLRPGCGAAAEATLRFAYAEREAWIDPLAHRHEPGSYDLCDHHAARTRPPSGWALRDRRPDAVPAPDVTPPIDLGGPGDAVPAPPPGTEAVSEDALAADVPEVDRAEAVPVPPDVPVPPVLVIDTRAVDRVLGSARVDGGRAASW